MNQMGGHAVSEAHQSVSIGMEAAAQCVRLRLVDLRRAKVTQRTRVAVSAVAAQLFEEGVTVEAQQQGDAALSECETAVPKGSSRLRQDTR